MQKARMMVLSIALIAAGGAAMIAKNMLPGAAPQAIEREVQVEVSSLEVLIAGRALSLGDAVATSDLKWQLWPENAAIDGYIVRRAKPNAIAELSGAIVRAPFLQGEPIKDQKLIKKDQGGVMAAILPRGRRAISTPIREETAAGGFILPNDRVDVIVTKRVTAQNKTRHVSETILENIRVLAIGQTIETKDGNKVATGKTATLELTPNQSETLTVAQSQGEISLALRSLSDARPVAEGTEEEGRRQKGVSIIRYSVPSIAQSAN